MTQPEISPLPDDAAAFHVIFRAHDKTDAVNGLPRPFDATKTEIVQVCFLSVVRALDVLHALRDIPHRLDVIADNVTDELNAFFLRFTGRGLFTSLSSGTFGSAGTMLESLQIGLSGRRDDWVYFCEDDYLHRPDAFAQILDLDDAIEPVTNHRTKRFLRGEFSTFPRMLHLSDYPDRYRADQIEPSLIVLTKSGHWRTVRNVTFCFLTRAESLRKFEPIFREAFSGKSDGLMSQRLLKRGLRPAMQCLSPIPGLATHLHEGVESPLWDAAPDFFELLEIVRDPARLSDMLDGFRRSALFWTPDGWASCKIEDSA